jgi:phospholipase C
VGNTRNRDAFRPRADRHDRGGSRGEPLLRPHARYHNLPGPTRVALEGLQADPVWRKKHANSGIEPFEFAIQEIDDPPREEATITLQLGTPATPGGPCPMNGFVESYRKLQPPPADERWVMHYYTAQWVPTFDFFARNYAACDRWFAALPTGTQADRLMAMSGETSLVDNAPLFVADQPLVYDWLTDHGISWCAYQDGMVCPSKSRRPAASSEAPRPMPNRL